MMILVRLSMEVACSPVKDFYLLQSKDCDMIIVRYNANSRSISCAGKNADLMQFLACFSSYYLVLQLKSFQ